jgi:hypothetical protein
MKASGLKINRMVKVQRHSSLVHTMKESSIMGKKKVLVNIFHHREPRMKDSLKEECFGDMAHLIGKTNGAIEAVGRQV